MGVAWVEPPPPVSPLGANAIDPVCAWGSSGFICIQSEHGEAVNGFWGGCMGGGVK